MKQPPPQGSGSTGGDQSCLCLSLMILELNMSVMSRNAKFACFDIANFYLMTPMDRPEYVRIKISDILQEFID